MDFNGVMFEECYMFWRKVGFLATVSQAFKFFNIVHCFVLCLEKSSLLSHCFSSIQSFSSMLFFSMFWRKIYLVGFLATISQIYKLVQLHTCSIHQ